MYRYVLSISSALVLAGEYAREALKRGLMLEEKFSVNPYKFGIGGATDSHTSLATAEEEISLANPSVLSRRRHGSSIPSSKATLARSRAI